MLYLHNETDEVGGQAEQAQVSFSSSELHKLLYFRLLQF